MYESNCMQRNPVGKYRQSLTSISVVTFNFWLKYLRQSNAVDIIPNSNYLSMLHRHLVDMLKHTLRSKASYLLL